MSDDHREPEVGGAAPNDTPDALTQLVSRRRALKVLGVAPFAAGAAMAQQTQPGAPQQPRQPHTTPNQPATQQRPGEEGGGGARRKFFTARELRTAAVLADDIIPRDERSGSATDAGVLNYIDFHMSVPETTEEARTAMHGGLRWIDTESQRRFGVRYHLARPEQRHQLLDDIAVPVAQAKPEMRHGAAWFSNFRSQVGAGFFSSAMGWKDLQYKGNVFNPSWNGCPQPALDKLQVSYDLMKTRVPSQATG